MYWSRIRNCIRREKEMEKDAFIHATKTSSPTLKKWITIKTKNKLSTRPVPD